MSAFVAIYLREMIILRRRFKKQAAAAAVSPFLYMLTFGYALGGRLGMDGRDYAEFLLPGLIAMGCMTQAFSMASEINVSRFYSAVFEEIQASPASRSAYVLGEICAGLTRALLGCAVVLVLGLLFGIRLQYDFFFWLGVFLNAFAFSALAVALAMLVKSHADQGLLNSFVITPMAFLGGTFFPLDKLPDRLQTILAILPLSHASRAIRAAAFGQPPRAGPFLALAGCCLAFFLLAMYTVKRAKD
ncbi:MAG: ABC transporter permease [Planctomycetota bacterium]|jgi:Nod factor-specific ABC transporter NodJ protein|nr:ABC transporter permease [Planctomycetota bacterium]